MQHFMKWSTHWPKIELRQACSHHAIQWGCQSWPGPCTKILNLLGLNLEWRQRRRASSHVGSPDPQAGGCLDAAQLGQKLHVLHAVRQGEHYAEHALQGSGLEQLQTKWRRVYPAKDHPVPPLFPGACPPGHTIAIGGKRRRLGVEPSFQRHPYGGQQMGIPHVGHADSATQAQQDASVDFRRASYPDGKDCSPWTTAVGGPQVLGITPCEPGEPPSGCGRGRPLEVGLESSVARSIRTSSIAPEAVRQRDHPVGPPTDQIGQSATLTAGQRHLPTIAEVTKSVMTATWANPGT